MKRILCIVSSLDAGGAETFLMKLYRSLPASEYQFDFAVSKEDGYYTREVLDRGGKIFFVPMRTQSPIQAFSRLRKVIRENGYTHVLKLGDSPIQAVDLLAAKLGGAKVLAHRSCNALTGLSWKGKLRDGIFRPMLNLLADIKIAPSDLAARYTFGERQYEKGNVHLLHNAVDLDVYRYDPQAREQIRKELGLEGKTVIGHVGRFNKQKNHKFLLEIFHEIQQKDDRAVLVLVGKGELEDTIRQQAKALGIDQKIIFTGVRSDVPALLSAMDVFVFPSFHEGMPNTVIEAQATGLPCVIADTITKTANITGLVEYLSLHTPAQQWAQQALQKVQLPRKDTRADFIANEYDIQSAVSRFQALVWGE